MILQAIIVAVFVVVFILNLIGDKYNNQKLKILTKPLLVPLIILFYLVSAEQINWLIVAALFFGFVGDFALLWGTNKLFFACGLLAFLVGHILYTTAFLQSIQYFKVVPSWYFLFIIPYLIYGLFILRILKPRLGNLIIPVAIYMCAILVMSFSSACRIWNGFNLQFILPFIGSLFFIVSDSVLAYNSFDAPSENHEMLIMTTYIIAQVLIMAGFLF